MAQPFVGEIRMFGGNFAPNGWMFCEGQPLPISENEVLFQLIGTTYGGDGEETFNLPNLASRLPLHAGTFQGTTYQIGEMAGSEDVTLTVQQIPIHSHPLMGSSDPASVRVLTDAVMGRTPAIAYAAEFTPEALAPQSVSPIGGSQPHTNVQPFLCINFIISLFGVFPSQT
ncbi:phage tail protein [Ramlibacter sp. WS9]|uniref:phage tail protein n=1 Tax=Ramlibacter sp. WS9 TaxID=1882741 RepID=UPI0011442BBE|nr:tail fiber protein [Ramlibacter sp. WS9]ROZ62394.1 phage tail protein [Ramlibacter sp. WS9]